MHRIMTIIFPEDANREDVQRMLDERAACDGQGEGATGLPSPISWNRYICKSEDEARKWIEDHDRSYAQLAVRFESDDVLQLSAKCRELMKRKDQAYRRYHGLADKVHYGNVKSAFVSCRKCGSRLSTRHIRSNICPMCSHDLRPESTIEAIRKAEKALREAEKAYRDEFRICERKNRRGKGIQWLVKAEWHC